MVMRQSGSQRTHRSNGKVRCLYATWPNNTGTTVTVSQLGWYDGLPLGAVKCMAVLEMFFSEKLSDGSIHSRDLFLLADYRIRWRALIGLVAASASYSAHVEERCLPQRWSGSRVCDLYFQNFLFRCELPAITAHPAASSIEVCTQTPAKKKGDDFDKGVKTCGQKRVHRPTAAPNCYARPMRSCRRFRRYESSPVTSRPVAHSGQKQRAIGRVQLFCATIDSALSHIFQ